MLIEGINMFNKTKLSCAIGLAMATIVNSPNASAEIEKIIVTATKRMESVQDVPVAVQALGQKSLEQLRVSKFENYIEFLPSASAGGRGPGQSEIYIRGVALDANGIIGAEFSPAPNVGFYLDEQPISLGGRNLDVYISDVERLEVLAGPQGTLFGASAQAGAVRIITNKPDSAGFSAGFDIDYSQTKGADNSAAVEGYVNIPIIDDELAVRFNYYNDRQGGFIDNVLNTFTVDPSVNPNPNPDFFNNGDVSQGLEDQWLNATFTEVDNSEQVEDNFNDSQYVGGRVGIQWDVHDNLSVLVQHTHQNLDVDGVFDYDPTLGERNVSRFSDDKLEDNFDLTSWSIDARIAQLEFVYTGGYLDREVQQSIDYIGYNNSGGFASDYYTCTYGVVRNCLDPNKRFVANVSNTRETHELRMITSSENRLSAVVGVFYDDQEITHVGDFDYTAAPELGFFPNRAFPDATSNDPDVKNAGVTFINDLTRNEKQIAIFGELYFDITDDLSLSLGARYYELEATFLGSSSFATTSAFGATKDAPSYGRNYDTSLAEISPLKQTGHIGKVTLDYHLTEDVLFYSTFSQGYRPGGFNRLSGAATNNNNLPQFDDFVVPAIYKTDDLTNMEFGWKTMLADGDVQFNGAIYKIDWTDIQIAILDNSNISSLTFTSNVADAEIIGVEFDLTWAATANLTLSSAVSYNHSKITSLNNGIDFTLAPVGSELPLSPELQYSLRARYYMTVMDNIDSYGQLSVQYSDESYSSLQLDVREKQSSYTVANASIGVDYEDYGIELYVDNLTNKLVEKHINTQDDIRRITVNRPRTIGLRVSYDFY
ncbi:MAG: iron complex outermembrane receptor protein [Oleiphilaceae bacterium]|jgi:iron complex outermembrane receptor protein